MKRFTILLALCTAILAVGVFFNAGAHGEAPLEGAYEFVHFASPDGADNSQKGMLLVKGNYLCHLRVDKEREKMVDDEASEVRAAKAAAAFDAANSTCGKFTIEGDVIAVTWAATLDPNDEGNTSRFSFTQEDGNLSISPAGATQFKFVYKRLH